MNVLDWYFGDFGGIQSEKGSQKLWDILHKVGFCSPRDFVI